jgi:nitrous oxide reductase accessory protein NosL
MNLNVNKKIRHNLILTCSLLLALSFLLAACGPAAMTEVPVPTQVATKESPTAAEAPTPTELPQPSQPIPLASLVEWTPARNHSVHSHASASYIPRSVLSDRPFAQHL